MCSSVLFEQHPGHDALDDKRTPTPGCDTKNVLSHCQVAPYFSYWELVSYILTKDAMICFLLERSGCVHCSEFFGILAPALREKFLGRLYAWF